MKRLNLYPQSQKARLVTIVRLLCRKLDRPINSKDLRAHFRRFPEEQPLLLQRLGQQLFKAARPVPNGCPRLWKVATLEGSAYFAPNAKPYWAEKLKLFRLQSRIADDVRADLLAHAVLLLSSQYRGLAELALWSFHRTWAGELDRPELRNFPPASRLKLQVREAEEMVPVRPDIQFPKEEVIDVSLAKVRLRLAAAKWLGEEHASHINFHRYLARCRIGPCRTKLGYSARRIELLASSIWNPDEEESRLATSVLECQRSLYRLVH